MRSARFGGLTAALAWAALVSVAACNGRSGPASPPVTASSPDGSGHQSGSNMSAKPTATATATLTAEKLGRPPLTYLTVELTLHNPTDAPRWFVLRSRVPSGSGTGVDHGEARGSGAAIVATFTGTGGFHAVRVDGKSTATVANLVFNWWRPDVDAGKPALELTVADDLTLDGKPAAAWLGVAPLVADGAHLDAGGEPTHEHDTDGPEATVGLVGAVSSTVDLAK